MKKTRRVGLIFLSFLCSYLLAQNQKGDTTNCDCITAKVINITSNKKIGPSIVCRGPGAKQEISRSKLNTKYSFEIEHNSAWYKLLINTTGYLSFDLIPEDQNADFDFVLFRTNKNKFCDSLDKYRIKPIRANISRNKSKLKGMTGLNLTAQKELVREGINDAYSLSIKVNQSEIYYLVLDNVYNNVSSYTIEFYIEQKVNVKGVVTNDEGYPLITSVTINNNKGELISGTISDPKSGEYEIHTILRKNILYSINYFNDSSFIYSKIITLGDTVELQDIRIILPKLKKGKKYSMGNINFYEGSPQYLPSALPSIENLVKLMIINKDLRILIEGHYNCAYPEHKGQKIDRTLLNDDYEDLSLERAKKIKKYLINKGIEQFRISTIGKRCEEMIFPEAKNKEEQEANRRIEIKVIEY